MNYFPPLILSVFIHLGLVLSFSNFFNLDLEAFNIETSKPIQAYLIIEQEKNLLKKRNISIPKENEQDIQNKDSPERIKLSDVNYELDQISILEVKNQSNEVDKNKLISLTELENFSSIIKSQVMDNWKRPSQLKFNLRTEIQIILVPTGEIVSASIIKGSGNLAFDESALTAISKVKSFEGLSMQMSLFDQHFRNFILIFSPE
ncbi:TonB C-terminal domain-containing protein [Gammaproteobacteria bacterium]|nr:TonB C-terminal domain-containing protein [Gammaproteobacteria bacterium]|tara:strand:- start:2127 stop:2738 length:612 start_codon:yes stop_codon:yes gene_type:complete